METGCGLGEVWNQNASVPRSTNRVRARACPAGVGTVTCTGDVTSSPSWSAVAAPPRAARNTG